MAGPATHPLRPRRRILEPKGAWSEPLLHFSARGACRGIIELFEKFWTELMSEAGEMQGLGELSKLPIDPRAETLPQPK